MINSICLTLIDVTEINTGNSFPKLVLCGCQEIDSCLIKDPSPLLTTLQFRLHGQRRNIDLDLFKTVTSSISEIISLLHSFQNKNSKSRLSLSKLIAAVVSNLSTTYELNLIYFKY